MIRSRLGSGARGWGASSSDRERRRSTGPTNGAHSAGATLAGRFVAARLVGGVRDGPGILPDIPGHRRAVRHARRLGFRVR